MDWQGYKNYDHYWLVNQRGSWINEIRESNPELIPYGKKHMWNIPASFDIETSSYKTLGVKKATMYVWSLNINGSTLVGRTWREFVDTIEYVKVHMHTDKNILIIYVHNRFI